MSNELKRSELIKNRMIECFRNGEIYTHHSIEILNFLAKEFKLSTLSEAAKVKGITPAGMHGRVREGKEMTIELNGKTLIAL